MYILQYFFFLRYITWNSMQKLFDLQPMNKIIHFLINITGMNTINILISYTG